MTPHPPSQPWPSLSQIWPSFDEPEDPSQPTSPCPGRGRGQISTRRARPAGGASLGMCPRGRGTGRPTWPVYEPRPGGTYWQRWVLVHPDADRMWLGLRCLSGLSPTAAPTQRRDVAPSSKGTRVVPPSLVPRPGSTWGVGFFRRGRISARGFEDSGTYDFQMADDLRRGIRRKRTAQIGRPFAEAGRLSEPATFAGRGD